MEAPGASGEATRPSLIERLRHPAWGIGLALLLVVGDIRMNPGADHEVGDPVGVSGTILWFPAVGLVLALGALASGRTDRAWPWLLGGAVVGIIAAIAMGDLYTVQDNGSGGSIAPAWRDALLPASTIIAAGLGVFWYFRDDAGLAETLLVTGMVGTALVPYAQQRALLWAAILALVVTYLWLVPRLTSFSRYTGLVLHAIALIGFVQYEPQWFAWTPFPFLTLFPAYIVALYLRVEAGQVRRVAWWTGVVTTGGAAALGMSTLIGRILDDLPVMESVVMLAAGLIFLGLFMALRRLRPVAESAPLPA